MKLKLPILLFVLVILVSADQSHRVLAAGPTDNQNWQCLEATKLDSHLVTLASKPKNPFYPPGVDVYLVECLSTSSGDICTTGEEPTDRIVFGQTNNNLRRLQSSYNYVRSRFSGTQPTQSDNTGKIGPFQWQSDVAEELGHTFWGVNFLPPLPITDYNPSLQLGTFIFQNANSKCQSQRWDPYGRTFDSTSLEPISGVSVTLNTRVSGVVTKYNLSGLINPQRTRADGAFSFLVPDGVYLLKPSVSTHTFPNSPAKLHPNYVKAYFDIYRGEDIIQSGGIQHKDIPLDPIGAPVKVSARVLNYSKQLDKVNSAYVINGAVSHPLSHVQVYNGSDLAIEVEADVFGVFEVIIDAKSIDSSLPLTIRVVKVDLTKRSASLLEKILHFVNLFKQPVFAQTDLSYVTFDTIPNHIEGYAYNSSGQIVPNAQILITMDNSNQPFFTTAADDTGFFRIPSQYLPALSFYLQIISVEGKSSKLTTTEFTKMNKKYIESENVNFGEYRPDPVVSQISQTPTPENNPAETPQAYTNETINILPINTGKTNTDELTRQSTIITLILVALFSFGAAIYYYKKRKNSLKLKA